MSRIGYAAGMLDSCWSVDTRRLVSQGIKIRLSTAAEACSTLLGDARALAAIEELHADLLLADSIFACSSLREALHRLLVLWSLQASALLYASALFSHPTLISDVWEFCGPINNCCTVR